MYLKKFRSGIVQTLHRVTEVVCIAEVKIRLVQHSLDHFKIRGIVLNLLFAQVQQRSGVGQHIRGHYLEDLLTGYRSKPLRICDDNQIATCQQTNCANDAPNLSPTRRLRDLTCGSD